ncbi:unnamed protein product [Didymodactylos carnosus]|uniref:Uncharacterized protein n=1 Tax=Didymodactylos carnosus TaxID=1234261 RepID=A0A8S2EUQ3_9BILA|nr:unnamed protein product [Didymodactylos carnosus]CAF4120787.1 unnamed protein product [Didymodactylos carnosus]
MFKTIILFHFFFISLLPLSFSIRCICKCNDHVQFQAAIVREPPYTECVQDSECKPYCWNAIPFSCAVTSECDRSPRPPTRSTPSLSASSITSPNGVATTTQPPAIMVKWEGTFLVDKNSCNSQQCCCPTNRIEIKSISEKPFFLLVKTELIGGEENCGFNSDGLDVTVPLPLQGSDSFTVPFQSTNIEFRMNDDTIHTTYLTNSWTKCCAKALRTSASSRNIGHMSMILSLLLLT